MVLYFLVVLKLRKDYQKTISIFDFDYFIINQYGSFFIRWGSDDEYIVSPLFEPELDTLFELNGWVFLDIWSHIGKYSIKIAWMNPENRVYAFEANDSTFSSLQINIIKNKLSNIKAINKAVSNYDGKINFISNMKNTWISRVEKTDQDHIMGNVKEQDCISIDNFLKSQQDLDVSEIKLIKIDVEWHEFNVIKGMEQVLKISQDVQIICEITNNKEEIISFMENLWFSSKIIVEGYFLFTK